MNLAAAHGTKNKVFSFSGITLFGTIARYVRVHKQTADRMCNQQVFILQLTISDRHACKRAGFFIEEVNSIGFRCTCFYAPALTDKTLFLF